MNLSADADVCSLLLRSGRIAAQQRSVTRCTTLSGYSSHPSGSENHCRHWPRFDPARMPISTSGSIPPVGWTLGRSQARPAGALSLPCHEGPARTRVEGAGPPLTNYHRPLNWQSLGGAGGRHFATRQAFVVDSWGHERTSVLRVQFLALVRLFSFPKPSIRHQRKARWRQNPNLQGSTSRFFPLRFPRPISTSPRRSGAVVGNPTSRGNKTEAGGAAAGRSLPELHSALKGNRSRPNCANRPGANQRLP